MLEEDGFRSAVERITAEFSAGISDSAPVAFAGALDAPPLEHTTRRYFIDAFLEALGWDLSRLDTDVVQEGRVRQVLTTGDRTLYLDYLGVDRNSREPALIVEAKSWSAPFVSPAPSQVEAAGHVPIRTEQLLARAVEHAKTKKNATGAPVTQAWAEYVLQLHTYIVTLHQQSGHIAKRVAICSGQWLIVFSEPAVFLGTDPVSASSIVALRAGDFVGSSNKIFKLLSRNNICRENVLTLRSSQVSAHTSGAEIKAVFRALWVVRNQNASQFTPHPLLSLHASVVLIRSDDVRLVVVDQDYNLIVPSSVEDIPSHLLRVAARSGELLAQVAEQLELDNLHVDDADAFPGFDAIQLRKPAPVPIGENRTLLLRPWLQKAGNYLLITGRASHFLKDDAGELCSFHDVGTCQKAGAPAHPPILTPSYEHRSYFSSGDRFHCSHGVVNDKKEHRCQLAVFERRLCCRSCHLMNLCWSHADLKKLPCEQGLGASE